MEEENYIKYIVCNCSFRVTGDNDTAILDGFEMHVIKEHIKKRQGV